MKTRIEYIVSWGIKETDMATFKTWKKALEFSININSSIIKVVGVKGSKTFETAYSIDTWKTAKNIQFDIECELF